jgi:hypothetical protein
MANSLSEPSGAFGKPIDVSVTLTERFQLPTEMEDLRHGLLDEAISVAAEYSDPATSDVVAQTGMEAWLRRQRAIAFYDEYWKPNLALLRKLVADERNTVWRFILSNAVRPQMIARRPVDMIVGNPPWLPVRAISERPYQESCHSASFEVRRPGRATRLGNGGARNSDHFCVLLC